MVRSLNQSIPPRGAPLTGIRASSQARARHRGQAESDSKPVLSRARVNKECLVTTRNETIQCDC
jgi:hypothetical protein